VTAARPRPRLRGDTPILHAAGAVLAYQVGCLDEASEALVARGAPADARKALLAAHRVRLALETFEDFLPERPVERLHDRLRGVARALDALVDADATIDAARAGGGAVAGDMEARRTAALRRVTTRLTAARHAQWRRRMGRLLSLLEARVAAGDLEAGFFRQPPTDYVGDDEKRPHRLYMRHLVGSTIWRRYEEIRAYESLIDGRDEARLRPLAARCAALAFTLGLASDAAPAQARAASRRLADLEASLGGLRRAGSLPEAGPADAVDPHLVGAAWTAVVDDAFRSDLAAVAAAL
jgi:hypothetical protein